MPIGLQRLEDAVQVFSKLGGNVSGAIVVIFPALKQNASLNGWRLSFVSGQDH